MVMVVVMVVVAVLRRGWTPAWRLLPARMGVCVGGEGEHGESVGQMTSGGRAGDEEEEGLKGR